MATQNESFNSSGESFVKHTSAGEMPDPSKVSNIANRLRADANVFTPEGKSKYLILSLAGISMGFGIYFLIRSFKKYDLEAE